MRAQLATLQGRRNSSLMTIDEMADAIIEVVNER
jgi:hypothetical protein